MRERTGLSPRAEAVRAYFSTWDGYPKEPRAFQDVWVDIDGLCEEVVRLQDQSATHARRRGGGAAWVTA